MFMPPVIGYCRYILESLNFLRSEVGFQPKKPLQGLVSMIKYFLGQPMYVELLNCLLLKCHENLLKILLDPIGFEEISYKT